MVEAAKSKFTNDNIPDLFVHLDLRHPDRSSGNCNLVTDVAHDGNIIVSNGLLQQIQIPINIDPGERPKDQRNCKNPITYLDDVTNTDVPVGKNTVKVTNQCVCGGSKLNCPTNTPKGYFFNCYQSQCRAFPGCPTDSASKGECVCNAGTAPDEFDCGGDGKNPKDTYDNNRVGWSCNEDGITRKCEKEASKKGTAKSASSSEEKSKFILLLAESKSELKVLKGSVKHPLILQVTTEKPNDIVLTIEEPIKGGSRKDNAIEVTLSEPRVFDNGIYRYEFDYTAPSEIIEDELITFLVSEGITPLDSVEKALS